MRSIVVVLVAVAVAVVVAVVAPCVCFVDNSLGEAGRRAIEAGRSQNSTQRSLYL